MKLLFNILSFFGIYDNSIKFQRKWSQRYLNSNNKENFSNEWGKIDQYNKGLGDYRIVFNKIISMSKSFNSVLEIGCLDGKWSEILINHFNEVHLMDLDDKLFSFLEQKFGNNFKFYTTKGNELDQIDDDSIELVLSMDSFTMITK